MLFASGSTVIIPNGWEGNHATGRTVAKRWIYDSSQGFMSQETVISYRPTDYIDSETSLPSYLSS